MRRPVRQALRHATVSPRLVVAVLTIVAAVASPLLPDGLAARARGDGAGAALSGYSLSFDGSDSSVIAADAPSLRIESANAFTVAFWTSLRQIDNNVLPRFWEKGGNFLCVMGDTSNPRYETIGLEVANASGGGNANGGVSEFWGKTRLQTGRWYFVAVTFDGSKPSAQAQIYLDGKPERVANVYPWSGRLGSTAGKPWVIGRRTKDLARGLAGRLDAMLVYPIALSSAQIQQIYRGRAPKGPAADWEFDEAAGSVAGDGSGNGNDAAIANAVFAPR
jgi:hypothetical protein